MTTVDFDDHFFRAVRKSWRCADGRGEVDPFVSGNLGRFNDRHLDRTEDAGQHRLGDMRKMHIEIASQAAIDLCPERHG